MRDNLLRHRAYNAGRKSAQVTSRRISTPLKIGGVAVGAGAPIAVQSMTKTDTRDIPATVNQIKELEDCGCEIVRVAVPDKEAAEGISAIKKSISLPLIADIHFDYRLALAALQAGADGLRLNPGNIHDKAQTARIVSVAKERGIPIRIGVNAGSLPANFEPDAPLVSRMVDMVLKQIRLLESLDFNLIKVSLKAFDVPTTIQAYQLIADKIPYPLHLGITEAGLPRAGAIRSAVGIGILLYQGIGDTVRVSLSAHPCEEVFVAHEILKSLGLGQRGPTLVSCPSCGRAEVDVISLAESVSKHLEKITDPIKVAVMGCVVNGPGEAKDADVGLACGKGKGAIFRKGKAIRTVAEEDFLEALMAEIRQEL
jgi:(E)-4-hydroxy-3-methylbut-2-enyl-diphosphate synthase